MPSFELKVQTSLPELEGLRLSETHRIKEAKISSLIELTHCKAQEEGLIQSGPDTSAEGNAIVIDKDFYFGKSSHHHLLCFATKKLLTETVLTHFSVSFFSVI